MNIILGICLGPQPSQIDQQATRCYDAAHTVHTKVVAPLQSLSEKVRNRFHSCTAPVADPARNSASREPSQQSLLCLRKVPVLLYRYSHLRLPYQGAKIMPPRQSTENLTVDCIIQADGFSLEAFGVHPPLSKNIRLFRRKKLLFITFVDFMTNLRIFIAEISYQARDKTAFNLILVLYRVKDARKPGKPMQTGETFQQHDQNNRLLLGPHTVRSQLNSPNNDAPYKVGKARSHPSSITRKRPLPFVSYIWQFGGRQAAIQRFL